MVPAQIMEHAYSTTLANVLPHGLVQIVQALAVGEKPHRPDVSMAEHAQATTLALVSLVSQVRDAISQLVTV